MVVRLHPLKAGVGGEWGFRQLIDLPYLRQCPLDLLDHVALFVGLRFIVGIARNHRCRSFPLIENPMRSTQNNPMAIRGEAHAGFPQSLISCGEFPPNDVEVQAENKEGKKSEENNDPVVRPDIWRYQEVERWRRFPQSLRTMCREWSIPQRTKSARLCLGGHRPNHMPEPRKACRSHHPQFRKLVLIFQGKVNWPIWAASLSLRKGM